MKMLWYNLVCNDNVIKKYLQNAINKTNTGSMPVEMPNIGTRYFNVFESDTKQN